MATLATPGGQTPQFDAFLFAPVGEDRNGMPVSVLSTLARLGRDPWKEAAALAGLPEGAARERLDTLLVTFCDVPSLTPNHRSIVARLVALLPPAGSIGAAPAKAASAGTTLPPRLRNAFWIGVLLVLLIGQAIALRPDVPAGSPADPSASVRIQTSR
jgi:hypothetical protein